jgi:hypothetical protein
MAWRALHGSDALQPSVLPRIHHAHPFSHANLRILSHSALLSSPLQSVFEHFFELLLHTCIVFDMMLM